MSDAGTDTTAPETSAPASTLTLPEQLRETLANAPAPLTLNELAKALPRPKKVKADEFENSLPGYLVEDLQAGRVFKVGSGKGGLERYWNRNEKDAIQEAVRTAATEPKKLAELKKLATGLTKADKAFAEGIVDEMVAGKQLHEHPGKGPLFGRDEAINPNNREKVSAAILTAAATPTKLADLIKATHKETKADKEFVTTVANELVEGKQLHAHPGKGPLFGRDEPINPNNKEKVSAAILKAAATPAKLAEFIKAALKETGAGKQFVEDLANELVTTEQLHKQGPSKSAPFGLVKPTPPHPLEVGSGKKEFDKLTKAGHKLLMSVTGVSIEDLLVHLRTSLAAEAAKPPEVKVPEPEQVLVTAPAE